MGESEIERREARRGRPKEKGKERVSHTKLTVIKYREQRNRKGKIRSK